MKIDKEAIKNELRKELARRELRFFTKQTFDKYEFTDFHKSYCQILQAFAEKKIKKLIISAPPQHGKQVSDDTLILTPNGFKKHGDLIIGDYVISNNGKFVKVLNVAEKLTQNKRVIFSDGSFIDCHDNHEWVVYDRNKKKELILETKYIQSKLPINYESKRGNRHRFQLPHKTVIGEHKDLIVNPYVLGVWLGDGKSSDSTICFAENDRIVCDWIRNNTIYCNGAEWEHKTTKVKYASLNGLSTDLRKYNILNNKRIPSIYFTSSYSQRLELLAGLIDTDGYVYHKANRVCFSGNNLDLINDVATLVNSFGCRTTISKSEPFTSTSGIKSNLPCYQLTFSPDFNIPCRLERKTNTKFNISKRKISIVKIETTENKIGNCIEVEGGVYLVGTNLIPTHNSELSTRRLPAFLFGLNPNVKIVVGSYNTTLARKFNRDIQRIMTDNSYIDLFPNSSLNSKNVITVNNYLRNSDEFEVVNSKGGLKAVGRGAGLTGFSVDVSILDDVYKDLQEGNSPVIRESAWDWYTSVIRTRLHNDSQELIVFTRWHNDDIIGRIQKKEKVVQIKSFAEIETLEKDVWVLVNFEAIKTNETTEIDNRILGSPLYPQKHSLQKLLNTKTLDSEVFDCLYQGNPISLKGLLYPNGFKTYNELPNKIIRKAYIDTADSGSDYLCSIVYDECTDGNAYVVDIIYTDEGAEVTEKWVSNQLNTLKVNHVDIESNAGGKAFARNIEKETNSYINAFHQKNNKESRVISNAGNVSNHVIFPSDWSIRFPLFYEHIAKFKKAFNSNKHDDCADSLTGVYEKLEKGNNNDIIW